MPTHRRRSHDEYEYSSLTINQPTQSTIQSRFRHLKVIDWLILLASLIFVGAVASIASITAVSYLYEQSDKGTKYQYSVDEWNNAYDQSSTPIDTRRDVQQCWNNQTAALYRANALYHQSQNQSNSHTTDRYTLADVMVIVTTSSVFHRSRCDVMLCTWACELPYGNVIFASDATDELNLIPAVNMLENEHVFNNKLDTNKVTTNGWKYAYQQGQKKSIKFYLRIDDDTFVAPHNLLRFVNRLNHNDRAFYGQVCGVNVRRESSPKRICGGGGELFTSGMLDLISPWFFDDCDSQRNRKAHDVFLPLCIVQNTGIRPTDAKEFNSQLPDFYYDNPDGLKDRPQGFGNAVTFHYVRPATKYMVLYALYQAFKE